MISGLAVGGDEKRIHLRMMETAVKSYQVYVECRSKADLVFEHLRN